MVAKSVAGQDQHAVRLSLQLALILERWSGKVTPCRVSLAPGPPRKPARKPASVAVFQSRGFSVENIAFRNVAFDPCIERLPWPLIRTRPPAAGDISSAFVLFHINTRLTLEAASDGLRPASLKALPPPAVTFMSYRPREVAPP
jgi:hypothetical protein